MALMCSTIATMASLGKAPPPLTTTTTSMMMKMVHKPYSSVSTTYNNLKLCSPGIMKHNKKDKSPTTITNTAAAGDVYLCPYFSDDEYDHLNILEASASAAAPRVSPLHADGGGKLQLLPSHDDQDNESDDEDDDDFIFMKWDADGAKFKLQIPGVRKKDLKLWFDSRSFNFEATTEDDEFEKGLFFGGAVEIPIVLLHLLNLNEAKVDLKDGVLKVVIPKLKLEERDDVVMVNVS